VDVSHVYSSITAGAAKGLHARISWRSRDMRSLRIWQRWAKVLSMAMRSEREVVSMAIVMWNFGLKGRSLRGGVAERSKLGRGSIW